MSKKVTLKGGKNATLIDMSVDTFDEWIRGSKLNNIKV